MGSCKVFVYNLYFNSMVTFMHMGEINLGVMCVGLCALENLHIHQVNIREIQTLEMCLLL